MLRSSLALGYLQHLIVPPSSPGASFYSCHFPFSPFLKDLMARGGRGRLGETSPTPHWPVGKRLRLLFLLQIRCKGPHAADGPPVRDFQHLIEQALHPFGFLAPQVAFSAFSAHQFSCAGTLEALGCRFVSLDFGHPIPPGYASQKRASCSVSYLVLDKEEGTLDVPSIYRLPTGRQPS